MALVLVKFVLTKFVIVVVVMFALVKDTVPVDRLLMTKLLTVPLTALIDPVLILFVASNVGVVIPVDKLSTPPDTFVAKTFVDVKLV